MFVVANVLVRAKGSSGACWAVTGAAPLGRECDGDERYADDRPRQAAAHGRRLTMLGMSPNAEDTELSAARQAQGRR
jgi:hypothetical protein